MGMPPGPSPEPGAEDMFLVVVVVDVRGDASGAISHDSFTMTETPLALLSLLLP